MHGVLFDLDGTLLDIDIESFLRRYFDALDETLDGIGHDLPDGSSAMRYIMQATNAMMQPHAGHTNRVVFFREYLRLTGMDLESEWEVFERFYEEVFPTLRGDVGPAQGAADAMAAARACGLRVAIATNPIFPLRAIEHRLGWAGIQPHEVDAITSYEVMTATKPHPDYFRQTADMLGLAPSDCLMVGDDRVLDLAAADVGMRTFYVGSDGAPADYSGDLAELGRVLPRLCETSGRSGA